MRAEADAGPVRGLAGVGEGLAVFDERHDEFVGQMRVRAAVAGALGEAQVCLLGQVIDALGRKGANHLRQPPGEVRDLDPPGDLRLGELGRVQDVGLVLDERPLEGLPGTVDVDALAVLPGDIEERAVDPGRQEP